MTAGFMRRCALLAVVLVGVRVTHCAALGGNVASSSSHAAILRIEASDVQSIPLTADSDDVDSDYNDDGGGADFSYPSRIYYGGGGNGNNYGNGFYPGIMIYDDSSDDGDDDDDDDDDDSDSDISINISGGRSHDTPRQRHKRFALARQWHLFPVSAGGDGDAWFSDNGGFQLELLVPGQVFVHVLKDDPDYHNEKKKVGGGGGSRTALVAKVVAMANDSAVLNDISVAEGSQGWSVVSRTKSLSAVGGLVVRVYLNGEIDKHLVSVVSKGAGDVVLAKKVVPTTAIAFAVSSQGNGGVYLHTSSKLSYVSLALQVAGSSSVFLHCSGLVSISNEIAMTVDGAGSISVKATRVSTTQLTTKVGDGGDICFAATKLQASVLNASVVQNGSITTSASHASSFSQNINIDGQGVIDTGTVNSMRTSVTIHGGPGDVTVSTAFDLEYSAPATSHVRYRGSRPMVVAARDDPVAPGSPSAQLERQSSSRKKCRAVTIPLEPEAVSLIDRNAGEATAIATIAVPSPTPSPPPPIMENLSSPAAIKALDHHRDPHELVIPEFPDKTTHTPSSTPAGTLESLEPQVEETLSPEISPTGPPVVLPSPEPSPEELLLPVPTATSPLSPSPPPPPMSPLTLNSPAPPTTAPCLSPVVPSPTPRATNSTLPATTATTPTASTASSSGVLAKVVDFALPIGAGFIAFIWLLHLVLQCCDRRSRRSQYQSINAGSPASGAGNDNEDPPVLI